MNMKHLQSWRSTGLAVLTLVACAACVTPKPPPAPPPGYRVINEMPRFWRFWKEAEALDPPQQARLFHETVVKEQPGLYAARVLGLDDRKPYEEMLVQRWKRVFPLVLPHFDTVRRLSEDLEQDLPRYDARFRRVFPDMAYTGDVYFMVSLGGFDGGTRKVNGATALLFGVDMIAYVYGDDANLEPLFDHELFHIYHEQFEDKADEDKLYRALWREGLATYVAWKMNPTATPRTIFGLPADMPGKSEASLPKLAKLLRERLDSERDTDYATFFLGNTVREDVPARSGYYVGYRVVERLAGNRPLAELARLKGPALRHEIEAALRELEAGRSSRTAALR